MTLWEIEGKLRAELDAVVAELAAHRAAYDSPSGKDYNDRTVIHDKLDAARVAWNAAYDAADDATYEGARVLL